MIVLAVVRRVMSEIITEIVYWRVGSVEENLRGERARMEYVTRLQKIAIHVRRNIVIKISLLIIKIQI